jgi:hypothetical protein
MRSMDEPGDGLVAREGFRGWLRHTYDDRTT